MMMSQRTDGHEDEGSIVLVMAQIIHISFTPITDFTAVFLHTAQRLSLVFHPKTSHPNHQQTRRLSEK
jgi:hypothetical protein